MTNKPPAVLTRSCLTYQGAEILITTGDLVADRDAYKQAYLLCVAQTGQLAAWDRAH